MDIRTLRYFVEVVRQQSFTRAAEKLFVTQPTISKMLSNLEAELNSTLLIRDGRRLLLTDTGQAVFQRGLTILAELGQLEDELHDINNLNGGALRLGIPPMVGTMIADAIGLYRQQYPDITLKIAEYGGLTMQQTVLNGELDVAITALPLENADDFSQIALFDHPLCVVVPREAPWTTRTQIEPEEFAEHPLLIYNEDFSLSRQLMQLFTRYGVSPHIVVRSGQWDFLAAMVERRVGIAILPAPICQKLNSNHVMWLPLNSQLTWKLGMIWRKGVYLSQSTQAWITCCQKLWPTLSDDQSST